MGLALCGPLNEAYEKVKAERQRGHVGAWLARLACGVSQHHVGADGPLAAFCEALGSMPFIATVLATDPRDDQISELTEHVVFLAAMTRALSDRVSALEGVESTPIDRSPLMTIKDAAFKSGLSESGVRKLVREYRIGHTWIGGRVFVTELPARRR
jgi:hypothetical protein